jgi:hypothetical protein
MICAARENDIGKNYTVIDFVIVSLYPGTGYL